MPCCSSCSPGSSRVINYQQGQGAPSCLMRHGMHLASNWSAQCACSLGAVTLGASISPRTASSTGSKLLGTQPLMTWTQQRTETSTQGLLALHRRIRSSRHSSASSLSWSGSCSLSQGKSHPGQQMQVTCPQYHPCRGTGSRYLQGKSWPSPIILVAP